MFNKEKKEAFSRLKRLDLSELKLERRKLFLVPLGRSICLSDLSKPSVKNYLKKKLLLIPTWKKRLLYLLLIFNMFPKVEVYLPRDIDLVRFGCRSKLFNFNKKEVIVFDEDFREYNSKKNKKNILNFPKIIKVKKNFYIEELIWPQEKIRNRDIIYAYKKLVDIYKKTLLEISASGVISFMEERKFGRLSLVLDLDRFKLEKFKCGLVHGDFWKGNLLKKGGEMFFVDLDNFGKGLIVEDLFVFFLSGYKYKKKIDKNFMKRLTLVLKKEIKLSNKELINQTNLISTLLLIGKEEEDIKGITKTRKAFLSILEK